MRKALFFIQKIEGEGGYKERNQYQKLDPHFRSLPFGLIKRILAGKVHRCPHKAKPAAANPPEQRRREDEYTPDERHPRDYPPINRVPDKPQSKVLEKHGGNYQEDEPGQEIKGIKLLTIHDSYLFIIC
jgi:hypothetical protein